jgi:DNA-binding NtrC family response regulator
LFGGQPQDVEDGKQVRHGLLESAQGGTLFLSDVEALPFWAQVRLFDTFRRGYVDRFASSESAPPDVRLIASTSCDPEAAMAEGRFYGGLYYLLNVTAVRIPPLRERRQDIKMLVDHYLRHTLLGQRIDTGKTPWSFTEEAWQCLLNHDWPGNLPELAGVVAHAVAVTNGKTIGKDVIACSPQRPEPHGGDDVSTFLTGKLCEIERHVIEEVIHRCGGNKAAAARALGLHRRTLYRMLEEGAGDATADDSGEKR